jgi:uncharacterized protein YbaP (TraB family)
MHIIQSLRQYRFWLSLVFIFLVASLTYINVAEARETLADTKRHFLWSVESENNTIYLLGSIHFMKKDSYPLPEAVESIYDCCSTVVFETDLDGMKDPHSQMNIMKKGLYPSGHTLSRNISSRTYELLRQKMTDMGLPVSQFEPFKPWMVSLTIASAEILRLGFEPDLGIDPYFFNKARRDKKTMLFLESNEFQINLLAGLSKRQQEEFLRQTLKDLEVLEENFNVMIDAWEDGNADKLASFFMTSFDEYPDLYRRILTDRNTRWVSRISNMMREGNDILVIVGAAHLAGKDSVIELLRKRGYTVRQR